MSNQTSRPNRSGPKNKQGTGFRERHPGMAGLVYAEDARGFRANMRKHLRNPPMRTVLLLLIIVLAIPTAIIYPKVSQVAQENWVDVQQARERHFINVTAASWIFPYLRRQAVRMQEADV
ncbi:MAG: hypothetical protein V3T49_06015, partial [Dehalococcoidia bacterium]